MSKLGNALEMICLLSSGRKYSIQELSLRLEVTPRMIRTYKTELERAGFLIETIYGPYGGYVLKKNSFSLPISFNERDIKILEEIGDDRVKSILARMKMLVDNKSAKIEIDETYNILSRAIKESRKVEITYDSKGKGVRSRVIHPYEIFYLKNGFGVAAYCELKKDFRHFEFSRIQKIHLLQDFF